MKLGNEYACLHDNDQQKIQSMDQLNTEMLANINISQISTVFLKNPTILKKLIGVGSPDEDLYLQIEIQIQYDSDAGGYFANEVCSKKLGLQIAYFCFGFLYDQISSLRSYGHLVSDCHLGNIFIKDSRFY